MTVIDVVQKWLETDCVTVCHIASLCGCAVVTLRQLERQLEREKEKSNVELTAAHAVHQDEVEKLVKQLQTLHSDNNLLMVCSLQLHVMILWGDHKLFCFWRNVTYTSLFLRSVKKVAAVSESLVLGHCV